MASCNVSATTYSLFSVSKHYKHRDPCIPAGLRDILLLFRVTTVSLMPLLSVSCFPLMPVTLSGHQVVYCEFCQKLHDICSGITLHSCQLAACDIGDICGYMAKHADFVDCGFNAVERLNALYLSQCQSRKNTLYSPNVDIVR